MSTSVFPILKLPQETLDRICEVVAQDDLKYGGKSVSLTCKAFRHSGQRVIFHTFTLRLTLTSIAKLISISKHLVLKDYVRNIVCCDGECKRKDENGFSFAAWQKKYSLQDAGNLLGEECDAIKSSEDWDHARRFFRSDAFDITGYSYGQRYLKIHGNAEKLLRGPLSSLSALASIEAVAAWLVLEIYLDITHLRPLGELKLVGITTSEFVEKLPVLQNAKIPLTCLKSLTLDFASSSKIPTSIANTAAFLSGLGLLHTLNIKSVFGRHLLQRRLAFTLSAFFNPGGHWNQLKNLSLGCMLADYQQLTTLLCTHSSTLKSLRLHTIRLTSVHANTQEPISWMTMFIFLNENMTLREFELNGILETVDGGEDHTSKMLKAGIGEFWQAGCELSWNTDDELSDEDGEECILPFYTCTEWKKVEAYNTSPVILGVDCEQGMNCLNQRIKQFVLRRGAFPFEIRPPQIGYDPLWLSAHHIRYRYRKRIPWTWPKDRHFYWDEDRFQLNRYKAI